ncbi:MAG: DUF2085 domain-containing protein [Phycisphaerae bacterium]|nr:DUF2085 domain-containing protein [Phycisphaerae bacterium]
MNPVHALFSLICHQDPDRSFTIAGTVLPCCQRCTGLYLGLAVGLMVQLLSASYKRGLPPKGILYTLIACLLVMPVFGFHLLDPGPGWRFWTGLIYGDALAYLLLPAVFTIATRGTAVGPYTPRSAMAFWAQFAFVNALPLWFPVQSAAFVYAVLALDLAGALGVILCLAVCLAVIVQTALGRFLLKGDLHATRPS